MRSFLQALVVSVSIVAGLGCSVGPFPGDGGSDAGDAGPFDFIDDAGINTLGVSSDWSCLAFVSTNDLWIRTSQGGTPRFDYRIGAGGAIAELKQVLGGSSQELLAPSFDGEVTDRIIQWRWWSNGLIGEADAGDPRWNVAQGGTFLDPQNGAAYLLAPTVSATLQNTSNICEIDVYSVPQDQWNPRLQSQLQGKVSALTRYRVIQDGELMIRRTMLVNTVVPDGGPGVNDGGALDHLYIEAWSPFAQPTFNAIATQVTDAGLPSTWYTTGAGFPSALNLDVSSSAGYGVALTIPAPQLNLAVGLVYGTEQPCMYHENICTRAPNPLQIPSWPHDGGESSVPAYAFDVSQFTNGVALRPGLSFRGLLPGTVIDQYLILIPNRVMGIELAADLAVAVPLIPAPRVLPPNSHLDPGLAAVVSTLQANLGQAGTRTDHLAPLLTH